MFGGTRIFPILISQNCSARCSSVSVFSVWCEATMSLVLTRATSHSATDLLPWSLTTWSAGRCERYATRSPRFLADTEHILGVDAIIRHVPTCPYLLDIRIPPSSSANSWSSAFSRRPLLKLCAIPDAALVAGVKKLVITWSAVSLVALDCWKEETITT